MSLFTGKISCVAGILLVTVIASSWAEDYPVFAEDQPSSTYTIYNGKVYVHPKESDGFFKNLFKLDLYKNPITSTVLGWTDYFYGSSPTNETESILPPAPEENMASSGSQNQAQFAPAPNSFNLFPKPSSSSSSPQKYPQFSPELGKQPNYYAPQYQYPNPGQFQGYPPQMNGFGPVQFPPVPLPPYINPHNFPLYGNPNMDLVHSMETQGHMDNFLGNEDRNFQAGYSPQHPRGVSETAQKAEDKVQKADHEEAAEDHYPCPNIGQWKWNGDVCIAIGPYPTWACKPHDLVMTGRVAVCRNKIFFPNEP